jgi:hypothetical protein
MLENKHPVLEMPTGFWPTGAPQSMNLFADIASEQGTNSLLVGESCDVTKSIVYDLGATTGNRSSNRD